MRENAASNISSSYLDRIRSSYLETGLVARSKKEKDYSNRIWLLIALVETNQATSEQLCPLNMKTSISGQWIRLL